MLDNKEKILNDLKENKFYIGRMISGSKSFYRNLNPYNQVIFNANVFIHNGECFEKIWYGDLDITKDGYLLKEIGFNNEIILYVLSEMDGRFENEQTQNIISKNVWNTSENLLIIDEDYIKIKEEEKIIKSSEYQKLRKKLDKEIFNENKKFPKVKITKLLGANITHRLKISNDELNKFEKKELNKILNLLDSKKYDLYEKYNIVKMKNVNRYQREYLSYMFLDNKIMRILKIKNKKDIKCTNFWANEKVFKKFEKYDLLFENRIIRKFNSLLETEEDKFEYTIKEYEQKEIKHYYLCNIDRRLANDEKVNIESFNDNIIYVLDRN